MAFENESDEGVREAATARVLQRRATNPGDKHVLRVVAEEFSVREQTLREWVADASGWGEGSRPAVAPAVAAPFTVPAPAGAVAVVPDRRPEPEPEPEPEAELTAEPTLEPAAVAPVEPPAPDVPAEGDSATPKKRRRPRFSPVVTTRVARADEPVEAVADPAGPSPESSAAPAQPAPADEGPQDPPARPERTRPAASTRPGAPTEAAPAAVAPAAPADPAHAGPPPRVPAPAEPSADVAALEAEVAELRRENAVLKDALRVVLGA